MNRRALFFADKQRSLFSQYADLPMVEKEIISLQKQNLKFAPSNENNASLAKEVQEKLSCTKKNSDMNQNRQMDTNMHRTSASDSETNEGKNRQDQLNQNNSNQEDCRGPSGDDLKDDALKEELDKAVRSGTEEHYDEMENMEQDEKRDEERRHSAEPGKPDICKTKKGTENGPKSKENRSVKDSQTQSDSGTDETPGKLTPDQQSEKKVSYAEAVPKSKPGSSRGKVGRSIALDV